jgi:hypothetical protein
MDEFAHAREQQLALTRALEPACAQLGVGSSSLDVWRKERIARIVEALGAGDCDWTSLARSAVTAFLSEVSTSEDAPTTRSRSDAPRAEPVAQVNNRLAS